MTSVFFPKKVGKKSLNKKKEKRENAQNICNT
jgi:hypothetical protein